MTAILKNRRFQLALLGALVVVGVVTAAYLEQIWSGNQAETDEVIAQKLVQTIACTKAMGSLMRPGGEQPAAELPADAEARQKIQDCLAKGLITQEQIDLLGI